MEPTVHLNLFVRDQCHLCRLAEQTLDVMALQWVAVEIDDDPELEQRYGLRVPVARNPATGEEIDFPFGEKEIRSLLSIP